MISVLLVLLQTMMNSDQIVASGNGISGTRVTDAQVRSPGSNVEIGIEKRTIRTGTHSGTALSAAQIRGADYLAVSANPTGQAMIDPVTGKPTFPFRPFEEPSFTVPDMRLARLWINYCVARNRTIIVDGKPLAPALYEQKSCNYFEIQPGALRPGQSVRIEDQQP